MLSPVHSESQRGDFSFLFFALWRQIFSAALYLAFAVPGKFTSWVENVDLAPAPDS